MRLIEGPVTTRVEAEDLEWYQLVQALTIEDPDKHKKRDFQIGAWDGKHRFFDPVRREIPSGLVEYVVDTLEEEGVSVKVEPFVVPPARDIQISPQLLRGISLRDYQIAALQRMLRFGRGVVRSPPRSGKTVMQAAMCKLLDVPSLLLVERVRLMEQHAKLFAELGIDDVVTVGAGKHELGKHVIATVQTLYKALTEGKPWVRELLQTRELLLIDEAHHQVARTYLEVVQHCPARWRFGLSGTPFHDRGTKRKPIDLYLVGATGPLIFDISSSYLRQRGFLADPTIYMPTVVSPKFWDDDFASAYRRGITNNTDRNRMIVNIVRQLAKEDRRTLVLVARIEHGELLLRRLHKQGVRVAFTWSGNTLSTVNPAGNVVRQAKKHDELIEELREGKIQVLIGSQVLDEGIDIPYLNAVVIAGGMKSPIKVIQRAFRGMTAHAGKTDTLIFDFMDPMHAYLRRHSRERVQSYIEEEIEVNTVVPPIYTGDDGNARSADDSADADARSACEPGSESAESVADVRAGDVGTDD